MKPISNTSRITLLDLSRGIALLGILIMNIRLFSEPYSAYFSPSDLSDFSVLDKTWWAFQYLFADQKFMAMFSMLFGASAALIIDKYDGASFAGMRYFLRRQSILLLIGLCHAYLIWHGDILTYYAVCGLLLLPFIKAPIWSVLLCALALLTVGSVKSLLTYSTLVELAPRTLHFVLQQNFANLVHPDKQEIVAFTGSWMEQIAMRSQLAWHFHSSTFFEWGIFRVGGLMLLGLALYRIGFIRGACSLNRYKVIAALCLTIGISLSAIGFYLNWQAEWQFIYHFFKNSLWNYWGSVVTACGYFAIIALLHAYSGLAMIKNALQNIGRMALSNYLLQSALCSILFYGFGWFGQVTGAQCLLIILPMWILQIVLSNLWLRFHSMGPLEKIWRDLSVNGRVQKQTVSD